MPLDTTNQGIMAQAMANSVAESDPTKSAPATPPSAQAAAATPAAAPPPPSAVPPDFFSTIGPQISKAFQDVQTAEEAPLPNPPPPLYENPPPTQAPYNPIHAWGSTAMFLAGIGSLLTRTPLTTALNAAGGVLTAYKQQNQEQASAAMDAWKAQTANALNMQKYEFSMYNHALKAHGDDVRAKTAALQAIAGSIKDAPVLAAMDMGGLPAVMDLLSKRKGAATSVANTSAYLQTAIDEEAAWKQYQQQNPPPKDPKLLPKWQAQTQAAKVSIFHGSIQQHNDNTSDPGDIIDPVTGYSPNQYLQMAQIRANGGKPPDFGEGKLAALQKHGYEDAVLKLAGQAPAKPGDLSPTSLKALGQAWARGTPMASLLSGMGTASTELKAEIINSGINYLMSEGKDPTSFVSAQADYQSKVGALKDIQKKAAQTSSYEQTVLDNMNLVKSLQPSVPTDIFPILNQIAQNGEVQTGSPAVLAYGAAMVSTLNEYAKVMSGGTGSAAASTDSARNEAQSLVARFNTGAQVDAVFAVMRQEMENRITEFDNTISVLNNSIQNDTPTGETPPDSSTPAPAASGPTPGTVEDGYRFNGGDPSNQANWSKVQ
jgi:hypothetical protein